jgi:PAS domain S-box-containing protein
MNHSQGDKMQPAGKDTGAPRRGGTLRSRLTLLITCSFIAILLLFMTTYYFMQGRIHSFTRSMKRVNTVSMLGKELSLSLMNQVSQAERALIRSGGELYEDYEKDNERIRKNIRAIQRLALSLEEWKKVEEIKVMHQDVDSMIQNAMTWKMRGDLPELQNVAEQLHEQMGQISAAVMELAIIDQKRVFRNLAQYRRALFRTPRFLVLAGFFILLLFSLISFFMIRRMLSPLDRLQTASVKVGRGEFGFRVPETGTAEMVRISSSFNQMTRALQENRARRKKMEARILSEKQFSENLFEHSYEAIFISDPDQDDILRVNRQCELLTGRNRQELLGMKMSDLVPEPEREKIEAEKEKIRTAGRRSFSDTHFLTKSGGMIDVERSETLLTYEDRELLQSCVRDVTELKRRQELFIQSQKMESVGTLASGIAHEFNNLLCGILGHVGFIKTCLDPDSPARKEVEIIEQSATKAAELTLRLTAFARVGPMQKKQINLNRIVKETEALLSGTAGRNIGIAVRRSDDALYINGDKNQITQVFLNIALNAFEAMPDGGTLEIRTRRAEFTEDVKTSEFTVPAGAYAVVEIQDSGVGMAEDIRKRVFEPFFSTREKRKGTGLGLSMSFGIIKNHDGYIGLESQADSGTTVTLYLPLLEIPKQEDAPPSRPVRAAGSAGCGILVVDDKKVVRDLCTRILSPEGYRVYLAADGGEALKIFERHREGIHLVLLDMLMPGMDGDEVFERLTRIDPDIRVIILSGFTPNEMTERILASGPHQFLAKPFHPEALLSMIETSLSS